MRDYGTGAWDGGDPDCDHQAPARQPRSERPDAHGFGTRSVLGAQDAGATVYRDVCGKCGARRVDRQLGLEATPDAYVAGMVTVFREVRRVLADHGTLWLNLGDSYAQTSGRTDRKDAGDEGDRSGIGGTEASVDTRPGDPRTRPGGGDLSTGGRGGADAGGGRMGHGGGGLVGREQEFNDRGRERGYDKGSNFSNYGGRIGEARSTTVGGLKPKDLCGIPWRVAFALQADGWYLRSDIIWAKPNPMPESVTDRPTKAHEYVFLLSKRPRYWFDAEAVRELNETTLKRPTYRAALGNNKHHGEVFGSGKEGRSLAGGGDNGYVNPAGRNVRSVWEIATQPYAEAHFATYPEELVRRCLLAGCPEWVCGTCGKPRERIVERPDWRGSIPAAEAHRDQPNGFSKTAPRGGGNGAWKKWRDENPDRLVGWSDCGHSKRYKGDEREGNYRPGVVLDPFLGSGTTALVARKHGRRTVGIELNPVYAELAARRCQQLSLLA